MIIHPSFLPFQAGFSKEVDCHNLLYYLVFQSGGALWFGGFYVVWWFLWCLAVFFVLLCGVVGIFADKKWKLFPEYRTAIAGTLQPTITPQT